MGHPAGFIEAFANMYEDIASKFLKKNNPYVFDYVHAIQGIKFFELCTKSYKNQKWIKKIKL